MVFFMNLYMFSIHIIYHKCIKEDNMKYDCIIIGAGLSGLTAASLLAKRGLSVAVCEQASKPGGSCGIFKRQIDGKPVVFDQGSSMLFGFGENGFNAHRFLFNCLEEPFYVLRHEYLYAVNYDGDRILFPGNIDDFIKELSGIFPGQSSNIARFYHDMTDLYNKVISDSPSYTTPDETDPVTGIRNILRHPIAYLKFLSYLNISADKLLRKYFNDEAILSFFDKLTSTYCYATLKEAPAILASVMFVDNHLGGSWYPAGSTLFLPGILEKVIEENGGHMYYDTMVNEIMLKPNGVILSNGDRCFADNVIYSGTVWNLYGKLLPDNVITDEMINWIDSQEPTYSSLALYAVVDRDAIPDDTCAVEMLASSPGTIDENEVTVYIPSIDDLTLCDKDHHVMIAIGPSFIDWGNKEGKYSEEIYQKQKSEETERIVVLINKRFPGIEEHIKYSELATPLTIERYTMKMNGAAAGPKQMLGQHMLKRQSIKTAWKGLYCCGESTTMGTGTPTVTISGIAAANAVLKKMGKDPFVWHKDIENCVFEMDTPASSNTIYDHYPKEKAEIMKLASQCLHCEDPSCCKKAFLDMPGIMRRVACGNFKGASNICNNSFINISDGFIKECEASCIGNVDISNVLSYIS